jgi:uncharacterized membrane protein
VGINGTKADQNRYMNMQNGLNIFMKIFLTTLLLFTFLQTQLYAQSFSRAMEMYQAEDYQQAAELFLNSDDDRSQLFAGKVSWP